MVNHHCCATCIHFETVKLKPHVYYRCSRLGFETKPSYVFNCWIPKDKVKTLIGKRNPKK